ncbi:MAG: hypothetical protein KGQ37_03090 [Hyphomicrobiales bacterium]|nr:hypothetical protein [Hyphomicrobiales bacterium]
MAAGQGCVSFIHASALVVRETGVLIRGASGAGKSALALALLETCGQRGCFGALLGDDRIGLKMAGGRLVAEGHPAVRGLIERRGTGIEPASHEAMALIGLVVDLVAAPHGGRLPEPSALVVELETVLLARMECGSSMDLSQKISAVWSRIVRIERQGMTGAI